MLNHQIKFLFVYLGFVHYLCIAEETQDMENPFEDIYKKRTTYAVVLSFLYRVASVLYLSQYKDSTSV
jgi:hypothetical protein